MQGHVDIVRTSPDRNQGRTQEDDDEEAMDVDDDVEVKQGPTAEDEVEYKEAMDQAQQDAETFSQFTFDENEVNFGDGYEDQDAC